MKTIVLISCVSKKREERCKASQLYISPLFKKNLEYAISLKADKIYVLSALYGLVELEEEISPYNKTLNNMKILERKIWAKETLSKLGERYDLKKDKFIFLAGKKYREFIIPEITNYEIPMEGLTIGRQLEFLSKKL